MFVAIRNLGKLLFGGDIRQPIGVLDSLKPLPLLLF